MSSAGWPVAPLRAAARERPRLVAALLAVAAVAWWSTAVRMAGMDQGPGTDLGAPVWFVGAWVVMMAAMMLPSAAPVVVLYARMAAGRGPGPHAFAAGYLVVWGLAGMAAYTVADAGRALCGSALAWDGAGRWVAGGTLLVAAAYELTPLKDACLRRCRSPVGFLMSSWRPGLLGATHMGARHGAWCIGCCWALMASLFALGVMSLTWMAVVAALVLVEKTVPWRRAATWATALVLLVLGVVLIAAPGRLPGMVVPGGAAGGGDMPATVDMEMR